MYNRHAFALEEEQQVYSHPGLLERTALVSALSQAPRQGRRPLGGEGGRGSLGSPESDAETDSNAETGRPILTRKFFRRRSDAETYE